MLFRSVSGFDPDASNTYYFYFNNPAALANSYRGKLSITPIEEDASLVTLSTSGFVPEQQADYLNRLMEVYRDYGLETKNQTADQTLDFINRQLATISDSLQIAEGNLEGFRLFNKLVDISREGTIAQVKLEQIDNERTSIQLQKSYYNYLRDYLESKSESGDVISPSVMGVTDQLLIQLVNELSRLQQEKKILEIGRAHV